MDLRAWLALLLGKLAILLSRRLGRGGSTFPGRVALRVDGRLLVKLADRHPHGNLLVTGTNGKTTTARMLAGAAEAAGWSVAHNRAGANLLPGITTAFLAAEPLGAFLNRAGAGAGGRDLGLAEVDEATVPRAAADLRPRLTLVTNFFRDQLDRYGELQHTVDLVREGLAATPPGGVAVLNADDPLVAGLGEGLPDLEILYYGVEDHGLARGEEGEAADARHCTRCGHPYEYAVTYYAHLGDYACPACGRRRPRPDVFLAAAEPADPGARLRIMTPVGELCARIPVPGLYNAYNAVAAAAAAYALGLPLAAITQGLETHAATFGRMEVIPARGRELAIALVKNPAGFNQVLRTVSEEGIPPKRVLIAINDLAADGTDVSWLWDVDFERLAPRETDFAFIRATGLRADEMALRLKYAGFPLAKVSADGDLARAIDDALAETPPGERLWLLPTYTALLEARQALHHRGLAPPFWEV